jgi:hypothetical protein
MNDEKATEVKLPSLEDEMWLKAEAFFNCELSMEERQFLIERYFDKKSPIYFKFNPHE